MLLKKMNFSDANIYAFADSIKHIVQIMFPQVPGAHLWGASELRQSIIQGAFKENIPLTCRQLLLDLGKIGREYNSNIWIDATIFKVNDFTANPNNIAIIQDLRFSNEFHTLKKNNFFICKIIRPGVSTNSIENDISEIDLDNFSDELFDMIIVNKGSKDDLNLEIDRLISLL